jgi:hypothetical protein
MFVGCLTNLYYIDRFRIYICRFLSMNEYGFYVVLPMHGHHDSSLHTSMHMVIASRHVQYFVLVGSI